MDLHEVFRSAVHLSCVADYTQEQLNVWAPASFDERGWADYMLGLNPFVVEDDRRIVGYADVQSDGLVDHFYVHGRHQRKGIGSMLMSAVLAESSKLQLARLYSHVSKTAQPFFKHFGFSVVEHRMRQIRGVVVPNALMEKTFIT